MDQQQQQPTSNQESLKQEESAARAPKATVDELTNDDIATLHNILYSGITVSAKIARNVANLQAWVGKIVEERNIPKGK